ETGGILAPAVADQKGALRVVVADEHRGVRCTEIAHGRPDAVRAARLGPTTLKKNRDGVTGADSLPVPVEGSTVLVAGNVERSRTVTRVRQRADSKRGERRARRVDERYRRLRQVDVVHGALSGDAAVFDQNVAGWPRRGFILSGKADVRIERLGRNSERN